MILQSLTLNTVMRLKNIKESPQLQIYKYYLEQEGYNVIAMGYLFLPKTSIRQKKDEDLIQFRKRLNVTMRKLKTTCLKIEPQEMEIIYFLNECREIKEAIQEKTFNWIKTLTMNVLHVILDLHQSI